MMNDIPEHWSCIIDTIRNSLADLGCVINGSDVEFLDEEACGSDGGEVALFGGLIFLSQCSGGDLMVDDGVDVSDPSVGIFSAFEPRGDSREMTIAESIAYIKMIADRIESDAQEDYFV